VAFLHINECTAGIYIFVEYLLRNVAFLHIRKRTAGDKYCCGIFVKKCGFSTHK